MGQNRLRCVHRTIIIILSFLSLLGFMDSSQAYDLPMSVQKTILQEFPDAIITETRIDRWEGRPVTEIELTTPDGRDLEVVISDSGEILNIEEEKGLPWIGGELTLGIAMNAERSMYKGVNSEIDPAPFFAYHNGPLHIIAYDSFDAVFDLYENSPFFVGLKGTMWMDSGYHPDDSDFLKGMYELETLYSAGLELGIKVAGVETSLEIMQDVSGEHDGQQVELAFAYQWTAAGCEWQPQLSLTWMSSEAVDYFYGISSREAREDRPAYSPRASYEIGAELLIQRPLFGNFSVIGLFEISTYGTEITDSPLVEEDFEIEGAIGVAYSF